MSKGRLLCNRVDMDLVPARERKGKSARPCSNVAGPPELLGNEIASQVYKEGALQYLIHIFREGFRAVQQWKLESF